MYTINSISVIHCFPVRIARIFWESAICSNFDIRENNIQYTESTAGTPKTALQKGISLLKWLKHHTKCIQKPFLSRHLKYKALYHWKQRNIAQTTEGTKMMYTTNTAMPYLGTRDTIFIQDIIYYIRWIIKPNILHEDAAFDIGLTYWTAQLSKWESQ
jgi:hypothetical protein